MTTKTETQEQQASAELATLTDAISACSHQLDALRAQRKDALQRWYDRGVPVRVMQAACGMNTEWAVRRLIETDLGRERAGRAH